MISTRCNRMVSQLFAITLFSLTSDREERVFCNAPMWCASMTSAILWVANGPRGASSRISKYQPSALPLGSSIWKRRRSRNRARRTVTFSSVRRTERNCCWSCLAKCKGCSDCGMVVPLGMVNYTYRIFHHMNDFRLRKKYGVHRVNDPPIGDAV